MEMFSNTVEHFQQSKKLKNVRCKSLDKECYRKCCCEKIQENTKLIRISITKNAKFFKKSWRKVEKLIYDSNNRRQSKKLEKALKLPHVFYKEQDKRTAGAKIKQWLSVKIASKIETESADVANKSNNAFQSIDETIVKTLQSSTNNVVDLHTIEWKVHKMFSS